jgi:hypothetical protein
MDQHQDMIWHNPIIDALVHAIVRLDGWLWRKRWGHAGG